MVNEAFVRRFFKNGEDPLAQRFGLDFPENAGTFRIVGVVEDMKWQSFALRQPARPMFYVPLAQTVPYTNELMARIERQSHFIGGMMLVTDLAPGAVEPMLTKALADNRFNQRTTAEALGLSYDQLRHALRRHDLIGTVA